MEELIAKMVKEILNETKAEDKKMIPVEASAKHVHLSKEHVEALFGKGYTLTKKRELSQPGQYLCEERVSLIGPKGMIQNVAVLGPERNNTQVEISLTDSRSLGVKPIIRESGDIKETSKIIISTGVEAVTLNKGVIVAKRHIHMTNEDAKRFNLKDKDEVSVKIHSNRPVVYEDVLVRVDDRFKLSMHIDFDEANAAALSKNTLGEIL